MPEVLTQIAVQPAAKASRKKKAWYRSPKVLRHAVMAFFFSFLVFVAVQHQIYGGGPKGTPSIEAFCPFGGIESLYQFVTTGGYIRRIQPSAMILFAATVLLTLVASRGFCGWVCPFGAVQEWIGALGRKIFRKRYNPAGKVDAVLRYLKYVLLVLILGLTWHTGSLVFRDYDPFLAFFHLGQGVDELPWAYAVLGVVLAGSLYIERFFCKYACPLGAVLGLISKAGLTKIQRDAVDCKECNLCQKKCHAHVDFLTTTTIRSAECNHCMDCVVDCPRPNVLSVSGPRWKFSHPVYASIVVGGLFLVTGASQLAGKWETKPPAVQLTNASGKLDPENIRGWMTFEEISKGYGVPLDRLYSETGLPRTISPALRLNRIGKTHNIEFEPDKVRDVVRNHLAGKPIVIAPLAAVLAPASSKQETKKPAALKPQSAKPEAKRGDRSGQGGGKDHPGGEEQEVKGFMTLNEISLKTGVPKDYLISTLGLPKDINGTLPVREWMHERGKSIQDLRDAVQKYRNGKR